MLWRQNRREVGRGRRATLRHVGFEVLDIRRQDARKCGYQERKLAWRETGSQLVRRGRISQATGAWSGK